MSCDYILPPVFADSYSVFSMHKLLVFLLKTWLADHQEILDFQAKIDSTAKFRGLGFAFHGSFPRLLPFIFTNYEMSARRGVKVQPGRMIAAAIEITKRDDVPAQVRQLFVPDGTAGMVIAFVRDLGQTQGVSQQLGIPAVCLTDQRFKEVNLAHSLYKTARGQVSHAQERYDSLVNFLMKLPQP